MLFTFLLWTMMAQAPARDAGLTLPQALMLAEQGRDAEALAALQALAAANPHDRETRLWIARLHGRMGNPARAEAVYHSVLLEEPGNVTATLGVADALLAQGDTKKAIEILGRAQRLDPQNAELLAALARAHRKAGHTTLSMRYLQVAVAIEPTPQHLTSLEGARRTDGHRIESHSFAEDFAGGAPGSRSSDLSVNLRLSDRLRIVGRGQAQRKFSVTDQRGGGGFEWRWRGSTDVAAHALVGPRNEVMPQGDFGVRLDHAMGAATWMGNVRFFGFDGASVTVVSPGVTWTATDRLALGLRYAAVMTDGAGLLTTEVGHTSQVSASYWLLRRVALNAGYARGVENFENFSVDRVGAFHANTASAGLRIELPTLTSVIGTYEHQWRESDLRMQRFTLSFAQRF